MEQHRWYEFSSVKIECILTDENVGFPQRRLLSLTLILERNNSRVCQDPL